jgi:hypothetical protein
MGRSLSWHVRNERHDTLVTAPVAGVIGADLPLDNEHDDGDAPMSSNRKIG